MRKSQFRSWVHFCWLENCEERLMYGYGPRLDQRTYWNYNKWWLRRQWRLKKEKDEERYRLFV